MAQTTQATTKPKATKAAKPAAVAPAGTGAVVGCGRTSTLDQEAGLEGQNRDLAAAGCLKVFERTPHLERQKEGIAKGQGRYKGRKPTVRAKAADVQRLREAGMTPTAIAAKLGVGRASVYRIMVGGGVSGPDSATLVPPVDADSLRLYAKQAGVASGAARREKAADYAAELAPILAELDPDGSMTLGQLASALTEREVPTMRGGPWSAVQVHRLKARMGGAA